MENRDDCWWSEARSTSSSSSARIRVGRSGKRVVVNLSGLVMIINNTKWKIEMTAGGAKHEVLLHRLQGYTCGEGTESW